MVILKWVGIFLALIIFLGAFIACSTRFLFGASPLGDVVNESKSKNYYFSKNNTDILYSQDGNWFNLGKSALNADVETFEVLGDTFGRDKDHVYYKEHRITDEVDADSFAPHSFMTAVDKNYVYTVIDNHKREAPFIRIIEHANPKTYEELEEEFRLYRDDQAYFYWGYQLLADRDSFQFIDSYYYKDKDHVYYIPEFREQLENKPYSFIMKEADPKTFEILEPYVWSKDKQFFFHHGKKAEVDHDSFQLTTNVLYQDKNVVYARFQDSFIAVPKVKSANFTVVNNELIYSDDFAVFFISQYAEDSNRDQTNSHPITDANTFRSIGNQYSDYYTIDGVLYYRGILIEGANGNEAVPVDGDRPKYVKDRNHVYFKGQKIDGADAETFQQNNYEIRDKYHQYRDGQVVKQ